MDAERVIVARVVGLDAHHDRLIASRRDVLGDGRRLDVRGKLHLLGYGRLGAPIGQNLVHLVSVSVDKQSAIRAVRVECNDVVTRFALHGTFAQGYGRLHRFALQDLPDVPVPAALAARVDDAAVRDENLGDVDAAPVGGHDDDVRPVRHAGGAVDGRLHAVHAEEYELVEVLLGTVDDVLEALGYGRL